MDARDRDPWNLDLIAEASAMTQPYCERQSRGLLPYVNTAQTVQDMDLIRQLLGFDKIDYLGYSGGTWLGAHYQTYFAEHVGRFVLDVRAVTHCTRGATGGRGIPGRLGQGRL